MQLARLYFTLKDLRWQQFWYRLWYPLKRKLYFLSETTENRFQPAESWGRCPLFSLPAFDHYDPVQRRFSLLNLQLNFRNAIDWNTTIYGMLWAYHLNYFAWLRDESMSIKERLGTLIEYCADPENIVVGLDSYPISIRGMAIIRFLLNYEIEELNVQRLTYQHFRRLYHFPEYHIQGNHLWQNACALICAGCYFKNLSFYSRGRRILNTALDEQILNDGGHIEGSPMYHSELLSALLQTIEIVTVLRSGDKNFIEKMKSNAASMLSWLREISFRNGEWPQVNDATGGIAPDLFVLNNYAALLNINAVSVQLKDSGYRMFRKEKYELFVDAGSIKPTWQPGHAHSDELSVYMNVNNKPVIVDPAVSTYETGKLRDQQRSTNGHNTVCIEHKNASDVWQSFRVGKKARVKIIKEDKSSIFLECITSHSSYIRNIITEDNYIVITDALNDYNNEQVSISFHFSKNISLKKLSKSEFLAGFLQINIEGNMGAEIETYYLSEEFNKQVPAQRLRIQAGKHTITRLLILNAD